MDDETRILLRRAADEATAYLGSLPDRPVGAVAAYEDIVGRLPAALPADGAAGGAVLDELVAAAEGAVVATGSPRYFGFVIGGALPAAVAADWLTTAWDQNAGLYAGGPIAAVLEEVAGRWLLDALDLPRDASFAVVTGCQMAHVTCLAAARHHVLASRGWDVERDGLHGAPAVRILAGARAHVTLGRALRLLGVGTASIEAVEVDAQGRMRAGDLAERLAGDDRPTIVCAQLGEVNTGAMDPVGAIVDAAHRHGAWVHVDGAFGLWARASAARRHLTEGAERADSWATDGHKWLNVPYDCGLAFCAHPDDHRRALGTQAAYLIAADAGQRDSMDWTPEFSRRARGIPLYAAIRSLGRSGIEALVDRCCDLATRFADGLRTVEGAEVLNDVVLDQVLVSFGSDERTHAVLAALQAGGVCWMSGTTWRDRAALRISVVNWQTGPEDVDRTLDAIREATASFADR